MARPRIETVSKAAAIRQIGQLNTANDELSLTKKELGAFYTPKNVASLVADWAIQSSKDVILEPGFGGCGFLEAAVGRLATLGSPSPQRQLFGCDVDPKAFGYLSEKLGIVNIDRRYILKDFITTNADDFSAQQFDVVMGNPPYVSLQSMGASQKESVQAWRSSNNVKLNGRASLWAYFVLHALSFLKRGGRMAWVLPGSLLHSNYSKELLDLVASRFGTVTSIHLAERVFLLEGTEERTVVLVCNGFDEPPKSHTTRYCASIDELSTVLLSLRGSGEATSTEISPCQKAGQLEAINISDAYKAIIADVHTVRLGEFCNVLIGTVTGANRFFIMSPSEALEYGLTSKYLRPIVAKFKFIDGARLTLNDIKAWARANRSHLLFHVPDKKISKAATAYMETFPERERSSNSTFRRRQGRWLAADDGRIPDGFLSYMTHDGPRIALNNAKLNSTNSVHRVYFQPETDEQKRKLIAISLCTTFSQLSAELEGRSYGSGVLKIEPTEAKKILLSMPRKLTTTQINQAFSDIDKCFRRGSALEARKVADKFIFGEAETIHRRIIQPLSMQLAVMRKRRQRAYDEI